jgi:hypothetical protein
VRSALILSWYWMRKGSAAGPSWVLEDRFSTVDPSEHEDGQEERAIGDHPALLHVPAGRRVEARTQAWSSATRCCCTPPITVVPVVGYAAWTLLR